MGVNSFKKKKKREKRIFPAGQIRENASHVPPARRIKGRLAAKKKNSFEQDHVVKTSTGILEAMQLSRSFDSIPDNVSRPIAGWTAGSATTAHFFKKKKRGHGRRRRVTPSCARPRSGEQPKGTRTGSSTLPPGADRERQQYRPHAHRATQRHRGPCKVS